ncbi:glycosyltransferase [Kutzneria chonburiensis]|uniref:4,4'-diaponeurosporenoate glycosyltransferase n=1 Tax=Kutzneria chonburiensis TaxID=1483604 RepID=A0ABV6N5Y3_9PSEU|nr:glycosyltransferase family 2 protein [Kutzneria chonburiensis]
MTSVVIPAHNEEAVLGRCLSTLLADADEDEFDVVVVPNACTDDTAAVARQYGVRVVETPYGGKAHALRLGDDTCRDFPRVYLDADIELSTQSVRELVSALQRPGVLACAPVPRWDLSGASRIARRVHRVHDRLIAPSRVLAGVGVYVLSKDGHAKAFPLPDVISDDGWVHRSFTPLERVVVPSAESVVRPARTVRAHLRRRKRVRQGNRELAALGRPPTEGRLRLSSLGSLITRRSVSLVDAACYLTVLVVDKFLARRKAEVDWAADASTR